MASENGIDYADPNGDGIPDSQEVDESPFPAEVEWFVNTSVGGAIKGLQAVTNVRRFVSLKAVAPSQIPGLPSNREFPIGFIAFGLECAEGAQVTVNVHLSQAAPTNAEWYFYNQVTRDVSVYSSATFSTTRTMVTLSLRDGGIGDADGEANGVIIDPSGYGVPIVPVTEGAGDDNCFISTAAGGSAPHILGAETSLMLLLLMALGAALFVRKVRK